MLKLFSPWMVNYLYLSNFTNTCIFTFHRITDFWELEGTLKNILLHPTATGPGRGAGGTIYFSCMSLAFSFPHRWKWFSQQNWAEITELHCTKLGLGVTQTKPWAVSYKVSGRGVIFGVADCSSIEKSSLSICYIFKECKYCLLFIKPYSF